MLRIALGQMEIIPGRPDLNTQAMLDMMAKARQGNAQMIVFPEMAVPGYLLGDTWEQRAFLRDCEECGHRIVEASADLCVLFGNVAVDWDKAGDDGRVRRYNAFFAAQNGRLCGGDNFPYPFRIKPLQPGCRDFDGARHFYSLRRLAEEMGGKVEDLLQPVNLNIFGRPVKLGYLFYEDGCSDDYVAGMATAARRNGPVDLLVNMSASPFTIGKNNSCKRVFAGLADDAGVPLIYVNSVGVQNNGKTVYVFDGCSTVYNGRGGIIDYCPSFSSELKFIDMNPAGNSGNLSPISVPDDEDIGSIYHALHYGIGKFLSSIGINKVVIGLSGGIDSALGACLYANVLGSENVLLVNMPSMYSSHTTRDLAAGLARNLGCLYAVMPIQESVDYTVKQISQTPVVSLKDGSRSHLPVNSSVAENIQARDRSARILAGMAAAFGGGFTCNSNKSEMTVGYSTMYGDLAGCLSALGDLWKHQVYALAEYLNEHVYRREVLPREIIELVPSAELSFEQAVDEGKGDPLIYPYHDYLFRAFVERVDRAVPEDILSWYAQGILEEKIGCEPGLVKRIFPGPQEFIADLERWWKMHTGIAVAKRIQSPPVLAVSRRAYGLDYREAQNKTHFTAEYLERKKVLLNN